MIDAHLDNLQAELEAEARAIRHLGTETERIDSLSATLDRQTELISRLRKKLADLRTSIEQQQLTLTDLRVGMSMFRRG
jgi:predicted RNase H-like nuclease (RuvC/YqgF family)